MRHFGFIVLCVIILISAGFYSYASEEVTNKLGDAADIDRAGRTDRIIVKFRDAMVAAPNAPTDRVKELSRRLGVQLTHLRVMATGAQVLLLESTYPITYVRELAELIAQDQSVLYAEPDYVLNAQSNDPRYRVQWHYHIPNTGIDLPKAWSFATGKGVVVAVIDTGMREHADLRGQFLPGYDFISDDEQANDDDNGRDADPSDPGDWCPSSGGSSTWHGLHVSGTVGALTNNGVGGAGIAYDAKILPVRVLGRCGGSYSDVVDGMIWSVGLPVPDTPLNGNAAAVINLSLGGPGPCGPSFVDAIKMMRSRNSTIVVAAGNSNADASGFQPGNCEGVISVAATSRTGAKASYSNFGRTVALAAPGGEQLPTADGVLSTMNTGTTVPGGDTYRFYTGTSMAAPHVAGVAALLYELKPDITPDQVLDLLRITAQKFPANLPGACDQSKCGAGIVDAGSAIEKVRATIFGETINNDQSDSASSKTK